MISAYPRQRFASNRTKIAALREALKGGDGQTIDAAFATWLARADGAPGPAAFARRWGDEGLVQALEAMARSRFGRGDSDWQPQAIEQGLSAARERFLASATTAATMPLPPLNP